MKNDTIKSVIVLTTICLVIALALAGVNAITKPIIDKNDTDQANAALREVLDGAFDFKELDGELPSTVKNAYIALGGEGYAFILEAKGFGSSPIRIAVGIDNNGSIVRVKTIDCSAESAGYGSKVGEDWFTERFDGANSENIGDVEIISGATVSSSAYKNAIIDALSAFKMLSGADK